MEAGIQVHTSSGRLRHDNIQAQLTGQLINRQRRYPSTLRRILGENMVLRQSADYDADGISEIQAFRALRRSREFVEAVQRESGGSQKPWNVTT